MRKFGWGAFLVLCLMAGSSPACAMDCAKAYLPVDFIICSDPTLLRVNKADEQAWRETRARLNDAEKQELLADRRRWLKEYPPRRGVPAQGKLLATIPKEAQERVSKALGERTAFLEQDHYPAAEARGTFEIQNGKRSNPTFSTGADQGGVRPRKTGLRVERSPLHPEAGAGDVAGCGNARRRLGRQRQAEPIEENPLVGIGLGVAAEDQRAPVGGREVDVEHLDGGQLVERGSRGEPRGERAESGRADNRPGSLPSLIRRLRRKYMAPILPEVRPPKKAVSLHYTRFAPAGHCIDSGSAAQRAEKSLFNGRVEKVGLT